MALKLELFPLSEEEEDWTYNHRIHRMIDGIGLLLVCNRVIDIAEVVDGLLKVGFKANTNSFYLFTLDWRDNFVRRCAVFIAIFFQISSSRIRMSNIVI